MELLKIKPLQEILHKGYCGPAVLKMALAYYGIEKSERELARLARTTKGTGTTGEMIVAVLKKFGLKPTMKNNASFSDIRRYLNKKIPVIVDWFTRGRSDYHDSAVADGHYSVVVGLDENFINSTRRPRACPWMNGGLRCWISLHGRARRRDRE